MKGHATSHRQLSSWLRSLKWWPALLCSSITMVSALVLSSISWVSTMHFFIFNEQSLYSFQDGAGVRFKARLWLKWFKSGPKHWRFTSWKYVFLFVFKMLKSTAYLYCMIFWVLVQRNLSFCCLTGMAKKRFIRLSTILIYILGCCSSRSVRHSEQSPVPGSFEARCCNLPGGITYHSKVRKPSCHRRLPLWGKKCSRGALNSGFSPP